MKLTFSTEDQLASLADKMKLLTTQTARMGKILQIRLQDRNRNEEIRKRTSFNDAYNDATGTELRLEGHDAKRRDNK
ncbi:hypothetical protein Y032_0147g2564 [Ancylostoma ceylanicum]|nr:hypothetical protein Y032_0147g2564 [Ancylostoma ceylanicum]